MAGERQRFHVRPESEYATTLNPPDRGPVGPLDKTDL